MRLEPLLTRIDKADGGSTSSATISSGSSSRSAVSRSTAQPKCVHGVHKSHEILSRARKRRRQQRRLCERSALKIRDRLLHFPQLLQRIGRVAHRPLGGLQLVAQHGTALRTHRVAVQTREDRSVHIAGRRLARHLVPSSLLSPFSELAKKG